jgi:hypothetical protein
MPQLIIPIHSRRKRARKLVQSHTLPGKRGIDVGSYSFTIGGQGEIANLLRENRRGHGVYTANPNLVLLPILAICVSIRDYHGRTKYRSSMQDKSSNVRTFRTNGELRAIDKPCLILIFDNTLRT